MRLRLTLGLFGLLLVALVLAGGVSLELVRNAAVAGAQRTARSEAVKLVAAAGTTASGAGCTAGDARSATPCPSFAAFLPLLKSVAGISEASIVVLGPKGRVVGHNDTGLPTRLLEGGPGARLVAGHPIDGTIGHLAYGAAPLVTTAGLTLALVLEIPIHDAFASVSYFLVAGGLSLLVALALAFVATSLVSRRVTHAAQAATSIAAGDLSARVPPARHDLPELTQLATAVNQMASSLEVARAAERRFLLAISHELRTPLTAIRGYAEAIADGASAEPAVAAEVIVSQSERLQRLINDLLQLARLEARTFELARARVDLGPLVTGATEALALAGAARGITLTSTVPDGALVALVDPHRLEQVLANLLENALRFATHRISVRLERDGAEAVISIDDDGPGISATDLPHVFEALYTGARPDASVEGTGLGLAIVAGLVAAMGGTVRAHSPTHDAGGTRLELRLPLEPVRPPRA